MTERTKQILITAVAPSLLALATLVTSIWGIYKVDQVHGLADGNLSQQQKIAAEQKSRSEQLEAAFKATGNVSPAPASASQPK